MSSHVRRLARLVPAKTTLLCCDIQESFRSHIHAFPSVVAVADKMIRAAHLLDVRVIATEQRPQALGYTVPKLPIAQLPRHLHPAWSPLAKTQFSMLVPEVRHQLTQWDTRSVVLFGIESHVCVLQTALDCLDNGYDVHVLADGVSSCNRSEVGIALERMRDAGAVVTTSESTLFQLVRDSTHPQFRSVIQLVKDTKGETSQALKELVVF